MATRIYDLAVKTGSYTNNEGQQRNRYETIGMVVDDGKGGKFILLKRTFNPAGVDAKDGKDSIMVSMFEPRDRDGNGGGERSPTPASKAPAGSLARKAQDMLGNANDIPF